MLAGKVQQAPHLQQAMAQQLAGAPAQRVGLQRVLPDGGRQALGIQVRVIGGPVANQVSEPGGGKATRCVSKQMSNHRCKVRSAVNSCNNTCFRRQAVKPCAGPNGSVFQRPVVRLDNHRDTVHDARHNSYSTAGVRPRKASHLMCGWQPGAQPNAL